MNKENLGLGSAYFVIVFYAYLVISWFINAYQLLQLDFEPSYRDEVVKAVGLFIPPLSGVTVWF